MWILYIIYDTKCVASKNGKVIVQTKTYIQYNGENEKRTSRERKKRKGKENSIKQWHNLIIYMLLKGNTWLYCLSLFVAVVLAPDPVVDVIVILIVIHWPVMTRVIEF